MIAGFLRYVVLLHSTWCMNSAHLLGDRLRGQHGPAQISFRVYPHNWRGLAQQPPRLSLRLQRQRARRAAVESHYGRAAHFGVLWQGLRLHVKGRGGVPVEELPEYTLGEVKALTNQPAALVVLNGLVYDLAEFAGQGGGAKTLRACYEKDCSKAFRGGVHKHTVAAENLLAQYRVGRLAASQHHPSAISN